MGAGGGGRLLLAMAVLHLKNKKQKENCTFCGVLRRFAAFCRSAFWLWGQFDRMKQTGQFVNPGRSTNDHKCGIKAYQIQLIPGEKNTTT